MDMGEIIKNRRLEMGYTQDELAKMLGLQKSAIAKYENGRVENIKRSVIQKMAAVLECSPAFLMGFEEPRAALKFSPEEVELIDGYRALSHEGRAAVRAFVAFTAAGEREKESRNSTG